MAVKRILHIWDIGGSSSVSLKAAKQTGKYDGDVIMRSEHDPAGFTKYFNGISLNVDGGVFLRVCHELAAAYDIIHTHGIYENLKALREAYPSKKIVLHYHGSDLLDCKDDHFRMMMEAYADAILVSTPDMIKHTEYCTKPKYYLPNAIDSDIYRPLKNTNKSEKALMFDMSYLNTEASVKYVREHCPWDFDLYDRDKDMIPFHQVPVLYSMYSKFIDIKIVNRVKTGNEPGAALSNAGLEALACGLEVFNYENKIINELPRQHTMEYHGLLLDHIYSSLWK